MEELQGLQLWGGREKNVKMCSSPQETWNSMNAWDEDLDKTGPKWVLVGIQCMFVDGWMFLGY